MGHVDGSITVDVFSYSHRDEILRDELEIHLTTLKPGRAGTRAKRVKGSGVFVWA